MITNTQDIPLNRLVHSKTNVRKTGRGSGVEALMASIEAHGLRQNLNVRATTGNRYEVVAGGRRLDALKRLMKDGKLQGDTAIPCVVLSDDDNAEEISLAENAIREAMHPDDQCTAFKDLIEGGMSLDDDAARFGVSPTFVRQRLKLADVSPRLRKKFRAGELDLSQMSALALVDDHAAQETAWEALPDWNRDADAIRRQVTEDGIAASHRMVRLVGIDAYEAAGGMVLRDLFDDEQPPILANAALVEQLAMQKLDEVDCYLKGEGWQWVDLALKPDYGTHYGRVYPQENENGELVYAPADLARAGARVILDHDGKMQIERGLLDAAATKAEARQTAKASGGADNATALNAALVEDLTAHRTAALRLELARNPAVALAATVHALAVKLLYDGYGRRSCLDVSVRSERLDPHVKAMAESSAHAALDELVAGWSETLPQHPKDLWAWCIAQDQPTLLTLLALLAGLSVDAVNRKGSGQSPELSHADRLAEALSLDMHQHWTPQPDVFFSRMSKALMIQTLNAQGETQQAAVLGKLKKPEAAARTAAALLAKGWLPDPLLIAPPVEEAEDDLDADVDGDEAEADEADDDGGDTETEIA